MSIKRGRKGRSLEKPDSGPQYRRNRQIRIREVRLIDENGEQVGIVPTSEALELAQRAGLDLVEVSPNARPPVCRILDFGKFKYEQKKKERGSGKKSPGSQLKELRVRPAIDRHDLEYRLDKGREFLEKGHKVQVVCIFRGRQMAHPEHGYNVMRTVADELKDLARVESPPRLMGRRMTMLLAPLSTRHVAAGGKSSTPEGAKGASAKEDSDAEEQARGEEARPSRPQAPSPPERSQRSSSATRPPSSSRTPRSAAPGPAAWASLTDN